MNEEYVDKKVREIEKVIDKVHNKNDIWKNDRTELIYNTLLVFEDMTRIVAPVSMMLMQDANIMINRNADCLDMLIKWIYECSEENNSEFTNEVNPGLYMKIGNLMNEAGKYRAICDAYVLYSRKLSTATLYNNDEGIKFDYLRGKTGEIEAYDLMRGNTKKNSAINKFDYNDPEMKKASDKLIMNLKVDNETVDYVITSDIWNGFYKLADLSVESSSELPGEWKLDVFSLNEFKSVWKTLLTLSIIHNTCCLKSGIKGGAINNCVIIKKFDELVDEITKYTQLDITKANTILQLLTYSEHNDNKNMDVIWTPIIPLKNNFVAIPPNLIMIGNPERNLICLVNKVNSKSYSLVSCKKEESMIEDFKNHINKYTNIEFAYTKKLPDPLPDMDIVMFDKNSDVLLIGELKWLLQTDSIQEVCERDKDIKKGISQASDIREYAEKNIDDVINRSYYEKQFHPTKIYTCVITRNNIGTSKVEDSTIKVIDEDGIYELIKEAKGNLSIVIEKIENKEYIRDKKIDYKSECKEIEYGGYTFSLDVVQANEDNYSIYDKKVISKKNKKPNRKISKNSKRINRRKKK
ncbi:hypothetical protein FC764_14025 [Clostridium botulinum]|nr:hypothetical protein [Clostridium botulinum]